MDIKNIILTIKTFLVNFIKDSTVYTYIIGISILSIYLTKVSIASHLTHYMNRDLTKIEYKGYSILYVVLFILLYIVLFFIIIAILVKILQMISDKYDAIGFMTLYKTFYQFIHTHYNSQNQYTLWISLGYACVVILVLSFVLIENARPLINQFYDQVPNMSIQEDEYMNKSEGAMEAIIDDHEGASFVYKMNDLISRMNFIFVPLFILIAGTAYN